MSQDNITLTPAQQKQIAAALFKIREASYLIDESLHAFQESCYEEVEGQDNFKPHVGRCLLDIIENANSYIMSVWTGEISKILWHDEYRSDNGSNFRSNVRINEVQIDADGGNVEMLDRGAS